MAAPVITILIPNFNRARLLRNLLLSIFSEIDKSALNNYVTVLVVDDFSQEDIEGSIKEFTSRRNFHFTLQREKCGNAEVAFFAALEFITTDYVWLFGNDDALLEGGLAQVVGALLSYNPSFILLNPVYKNQHRLFVGVNTILPVVYYDKTAQLFEDFGFITCTTTFSCLIAKTNKLKVFNRKYRLTNISTVYSHSFSFLGTFKDEPAVFMSNAIVSFSMSEAGEEQVKLQNQIPNMIMYYHQTLGVSALIRETSLITGLSISWFGGAIENEINKNDYTLYRNTLSAVILRFFIEQLIREKMNNMICDVKFNYLSKSEISVMENMFKDFKNKLWLEKFYEALALYNQQSLSTPLTVAHLNSLQKEAHLGGMEIQRRRRPLEPLGFKSVFLSRKAIMWSLLRGFS